MLSGCYNSPDFMKPLSWLFKEQMPKDAPAVYKKAWRDGCETGLSSMTNTAYKTFYSFKMNKKLRSNPNYYKTWKDLYNFCRHYAYGIVRLGGDRSRRPNDRTAFLETFMGANGLLETGPFILLSGPMQSPLSGLTNIRGIGDLGENWGYIGEGTREIGGGQRYIGHK